MTEPSLYRVAECLAMDSDAGTFIWKTGVYRGRNAGKVNDRGYLIITLDGVRMRAHRLMYALCQAAWPIDQIDHINGNKLDNRLANLRQVTNAVNQQNQYAARSDNALGFRGVSRGGSAIRPYRAEIISFGKRHYIGSFATAEEASRAYVEAKAVFHREAMAPHLSQEAI